MRDRTGRDGRRSGRLDRGSDRGGAPVGGGLRADDRGVSVAVGYVLTLAIGAVLLSGVVIGVGGVVDSQTERTIDGELEVVGETTVANLESVDRLARAAHEDRPSSGIDPTVSVIVDLPTRVAGIPYRIEVGNESVTLRTDAPAASVEVTHAAHLDVAPTSVRGGPLRIAYVDDGTGDAELEVTER